MVGTNDANAAMTCWPAERVASFSFSHDFGSASARPGSGLPLHAASHSAARSASSARQAWKRSVHAAWAAAPFSTALNAS